MAQALWLRIVCTTGWNSGGLRDWLEYRKLRMHQERKAVQAAAAASAKKAKKQAAISPNEEGPTPEELRRPQMRAGRFGSGAVDHSATARNYAPVYAVGPLHLTQLVQAYTRTAWLAGHPVLGYHSSVSQALRAGFSLR